MEIRALLAAMSRRKSGPLLVAVQVALAFATIVNLANVIQQRVEVASRPTGIDLKNTFWMTTEPTSADYDYSASVRRYLAYLNSMPGVVASALISTLPQTWSEYDLPFASRPQVFDRPRTGVEGIAIMGTDKVLDALGVKLIAGRNFNADAVQPALGDFRTSIARWAPEVIVTQALATKLFPGGGALGKTLYVGSINRSAVIVGIVGLLRLNPYQGQMDELARQVVIVPITPPGPSAAYVVRTKPGRRDEVMSELEKEFAAMQPGRFISGMEAYDVTAAKAREDYRTTIVILGAVAICVMLVSVLGMVGLSAFNVVTRTKQLGVRRAIGARRFHIVRYFLIESWITITGGLVGGVILAMSVGMELTRIFQLPRLPVCYLAVGAVVLWVVGLIAVLPPALRAAYTSPAVATRM